MAEIETLIHLERNGSALCGGLHATLLDTRPEAVTCPVCDGLHRSQHFLVGTVGKIAVAVQAKLAELQRDPQAQAMGALARLFIQADLAGRESRARAAARQVEAKKEPGR